MGQNQEASPPTLTGTVVATAQVLAAMESLKAWQAERDRETALMLLGATMLPE